MFIYLVIHKLYMKENMGVNVKVKKWGNSLGIILPNELIKEKEIHENDDIGILVFKETNLKKVFSILKNTKVKTNITAQEFKDESRRN